MCLAFFCCMLYPCRCSAGFSAAPAPIAPPAASASNNISVADPQVTSSALLGSGMGNSFTHHNDLKAPEPVVLSHQVCMLIFLSMIRWCLWLSPLRLSK